MRVPGSAGSNADVKVAALVAGMVAGADTIDAMDLLRHGGMGRVLTAGRAPSMLGTFLRWEAQTDVAAQPFHVSGTDGVSVSLP